jgi:hypothetical protein
MAFGVFEAGATRAGFLSIILRGHSFWNPDAAVIRGFQRSK